MAGLFENAEAAGTPRGELIYLATVSTGSGSDRLRREYAPAWSLSLPVLTELCLVLLFFDRKGSVCSNNVLAHRFTRFFRVAGANLAIDFAMELECFVEIVCALDRLAASLVKDC